ncbi:hypothetical protein [Pseudonocardia sp. ICBG1142]|uniref:hypothetical protein n=1 Tax=Pseudonocardia sp. ICBG1142 TaxID=2846760 RepID=UPI001CF632E9|nr:hypothetical protein [Pseudonocardia sp. ICBG1142]
MKLAIKMLHFGRTSSSGSRYIVCFSLVVAAFMGVTVSMEGDRYPGWNSDLVLEITRSSNATPWANTVAAIAEVADKHDAAVLRIDSDRRDSDRGRKVYVATGPSGSSGTSWAEERLRPFSTSSVLKLDIRPFDPLDSLDSRALYRIYGSRNAADELSVRLKELGMTGVLTESPTVMEVMALYAARSAGLFSGLIAAIMTMAISTVLLQARRYAVWRLHGAGLLRMAYWDGRSILPFLAASITVYAGITTAVLFIYNKWAQVSTFACFSVAMSLLTGTAISVAYFIGLLVVSSSSAMSSLKGRMRVLFSVGVLYFWRISAVLLVIPAVTGVATDWESLTHRTFDPPAYTNIDSRASIAMPAHRTEEDSNKDFEEVGAWLRRLDLSGRAIVMKRDSLRSNVSEWIPLENTELLWANGTLLAEQPLVDLAGVRIGPSLNGVIRVIIPEHLGQYSRAILESVQSEFSSEALPTGVAEPQIQTVLAKSGQSVFVYGTRSQTSTADGHSVDWPVSHDPVIISMQNGTPLISNERLAAWASYNGAITSKDDISSKSSHAPVEHLAGAIPIRGLLDDNYVIAKYRLSEDLLTLSLLSITLTLTVTTMRTLQVQRLKKAMYAGHIAGRGFWYTHYRAVLKEISIPVTILAWIAMSNWLRSKEINAYITAGMPPPPTASPSDWERLVPAMSIAGITSAGFIGLLYISYRKICSARPADPI